MEENGPLVSIVIPVYRGEKYIIKCLESITRQSYPAMEIVIVDDESPDNSVELIGKYAEKVNIPIMIVRQKNQGQGNARNTGIDKASGEYLMFVDQDDTIEHGILAKLLTCAIESGADIVSCGYRRITTDGKIEKEVRLECTEWSKYKIIAPWAKLYRTGFILKNQVRFLPVTLGEDVYFMINAYSHRPKVVFLQDIGYNWFDNEVSLSNTEYRKIGEKTSVLQLYNMLDCLEQKESLVGDRMYEYFLIKTTIWNILYTATENSYEAVIENSSQIWGWFDGHYTDYMHNPFVRISEPKGEILKIRLIVWGYMMIKRLKLEKLFLRILSKRKRSQ